VERPDDAERGGNVVGRAVEAELLEEPETLLRAGGGERVDVLARDGRVRADGGERIRAHLPHPKDGRLARISRRRAVRLEVLFNAFDPHARPAMAVPDETYSGPRTDSTSSDLLMRYAALSSGTRTGRPAAAPSARAAATASAIPATVGVANAAE